MNPEEQLDRLIEQRQQGELPRRIGDEELAARLAAVDALTQLQEIEPPPVFAAQLEARLRAQVRRRGQHNGRVHALPRPAKAVRVAVAPCIRCDLCHLGLLVSVSVINIRCITSLTDVIARAMSLRPRKAS